MTKSKINRMGWLPDWQTNIIRKYPLLYLEPSPETLKQYEKDLELLPGDYCNLRYGFECEAGWADLIDELSATGTSLVKALRAFGYQNDAIISAVIVKEKMGALTWQGTNNLLPPFHTLWFGYVGSMRERSRHTCEKSGQFGELRKIGNRFQTLCKAEHDKARKDQKEPRL